VPETDHFEGVPAAPTLYVLVGLPASGKTTRAREIEAEAPALRLTPDEWMIPLFGESEADGKRAVLEGRFIWLALQALREGANVILDFGVWTKNERLALRSLAAGVGASCQLEYFEIDEAEQKRRCEGRAVSQPHTTFVINDDDLREYRRLFEVPDHAELASSDAGPPPPGHTNWHLWAAERWPTSDAT
jgi:predicted kinase